MRIAARSLMLAVALAAATALATAPRWVVETQSGDTFVADAATGLEWQQVSTNGMVSWKDALAHCEGLSFAGHDDWRLPDVVELSTLVDDEKEEPPAINTVYFEGFEPGAGYWTSTTSRSTSTAAYVLYFNEQNTTVGRGGVSAIIKTTALRALCVRVP
ncbi:MAG: DUF1566 domain-containing protein [Polyangia bacterium]